MKFEMKSAICLKCANIFIDNQGDEIICTNCGNKFKRNKYNKIINYASAAAKYGFIYRLYYQKQVGKKGPIGKAALDEPSNIYTFAAIAALSGIIGNATYDLIKTVLKRIVEKIGNKTNKSSNVRVPHFFKDEDKIALFLQYIKDYHDEFYNVDTRVVTLLTEEIMADTHTNFIVEASKGRAAQLSIEEISQIFRNAIRSSSKRKKLKRADFNEIWECINNEISLKEKKRSPNNLLSKSLKRRATGSKKLGKKR